MNLRISFGHKFGLYLTAEILSLLAVEFHIDNVMLKTQKRVGQCEKPYSKYDKLCGLGSVWLCFHGCMSIYMISNGMWNSRVH